MNCIEARDALLVAELAELRARDVSTPLASHLADCSACAARAASIANQTANVGALVTGRRRVADRARPVRRFVFIASLPVAAVLIIAATMRLQGNAPAAPAPAAASRPVARNVSVDVARGQQTTVLKTADSTVTVIWLTPGVGQ